MTALRFAPRILFLSADPARVRAQLAGESLRLAEAAPLRDAVSTDEITPLLESAGLRLQKRIERPTKHGRVEVWYGLFTRDHA